MKNKQQSNFLKLQKYLGTFMKALKNDINLDKTTN